MSVAAPARLAPAAAAPLNAGGRRVGTGVFFLGLLAVMATLVMAVVVGVAEAGVGVAWGGVLWAVGALLVRHRGRGDRAVAARLYTGAFLARYVCALLIRSVLVWSDAPGLGGGSDYIHYEALGWAQADLWRNGHFVWAITYIDAGYFFIVAAVYTLTGRYVIAPTLLNALFGAVTAVFTYRLAERLFGRRVGVLAGALAAYIPTLLFWSSVLYKDVIVSCLMVVSVYLAMELRGRLSAPRAWTLGLVLGPLFALRTGVAATFVLLMAIYLLAGWKGLVSRRLPVLALSGVLVLGIIAVLEKFRIGAGGLVSGLATAITIIQDPSAGFSSEVARRGGTGLSSALYGKNLLLAPHLLVIATAFLLVTPVPGLGQLGLNIGTLLIPGQLVWIALLPAVGLGVLQMLRVRTAESLFLLAVVASSILAIVLGGFFSNPRYLVQVVPILLIAASLGVVQVGRRWHLYLAALCMVTSLLLAYGLVR
jgi:hypothetical protein